MYTLAFDTTGFGCSIILLKDEEIVAVFEKFSEFGQAEILIPQIKEMLRKNNITFAELDNLFVCVGPGSFTGVRSGVAAARVFQLAAPKIVVGGVSAFEAYRQSFDVQELAEINAVIIETRREDFYVQLFNRNGEKISDPEVMQYEELLKTLKNTGVTVSISGDGVERFLSKPSGLSLHAIKLEKFLPIKFLAFAGLKMLKERKINYPKPLYLRAPDVCVPQSKD